MSTNHLSKKQDRFLTVASGRWIWLAANVGFMVVVLDALTKWGIAQEIGPGAARSQIHIVGDFVELRYALNSGVAFGLLSGNSTLAGALVGLVIVPLVIVLAIMSMRGPLWAVASGLVVGGAAGNLLDRAGDGTVTDFVAVGRWPSFNVADTSITVGVLILLGLSLLDRGACRHERRGIGMSEPAAGSDDAIDEVESGDRITIHPETAHTGDRLDVYLASELTDFSRSFLQQLIASGNVLVDGLPRKRTFKITAGQAITISIPEPEPHDIQPQEIPLSIVYEDADIAVIDKPAGMVVHPAAGHADGTLVNALLFRYPEIALGGTNRPGVVHRLDKDTSGLIVIARTPAGQKLLLEQWADGSVQKGYKALVHGVVEPDEGTIDAPIGRAPVDRQRMAVIASGKPSVTHFTVEERFDSTTLLDVEIETGRTHQIRVHMAFIGHPVVADMLYARGSLPTCGLDRQFLHAWRLGLRLSDGTRRLFESPLPDDLQQTLAELRRGVPV